MLQIVNQQELQKLTKFLSKHLHFKDINFAVKIRDIHKIENKNSFGNSVFDYENKDKHPVNVS